MLYLDSKPVILVADGEDTAKDMYAKQGYVYQSFCYQILKKIWKLTIDGRFVLE